MAELTLKDMDSARPACTRMKVITHTCTETEMVSHRLANGRMNFHALASVLSDHQVVYIESPLPNIKVEIH